MPHTHGHPIAIRLTGDFVGPVMFYGRGAGQNPTASAIAGDLIGLARTMQAGAGRRMAPLGFLDREIKTIPLKPMAASESAIRELFRKDLGAMHAKLTG